MKKNIICIVLICVLIIFVGFLSLKKEEIKKHYFVSSEIKEFKRDDETVINDLEKYSTNIIKENIYKIDFSLFNPEQSITGYVYIADNKMLYIHDNNNKIDYLVSSLKFKTMYAKDYKYTDGVYIYLIGEDGKAYILNLESNDIRDAYLNNYSYNIKFTNFVDIDLKNDMYPIGNSVFLLTDTGKIYDINSALRYDERTISLYNQIYVYHDKTMTNTTGHLIMNNKGELYKIKYVFSTHSNNELFKDITPIIMVTENNEFIYFNQEMMYVYEFDKKVKDIKFDQYYPYIDGNLEITFEDGYKENFKASCNQYYCVNEFAK